MKQIIELLILDKRPIKRMFRRAIDRDESSWDIFISTKEPSIQILADRYIITAEKEPLRITDVAFHAPNLRFAPPAAGPSIDLKKVRFTSGAMTRFAQLFPEYLAGDTERSARIILAKASEHDAISEKLKNIRLLTHNFTASRYFRFFQCRFVVVEKDGMYHVLTIEKVLWK